ncbi:AcrR family transcriptional regulator [Sphingomonas xinjiangensis]|uniref:AcrR family transcriptional regulator n=1 Tax=Sphingomonas xinjiangensis TaxID=643568 RepID=A0A840YRM4_9SPHN|nr:AcrR family transcriptional regulator [Sphingomonas xinjiangensis]
MAPPRKYDENEVLDIVLWLFWERGYEGTSLSDILAATNLTKSSLYLVFGSKESLFPRALERYDREYLQFRRAPLESGRPAPSPHAFSGVPLNCTGIATRRLAASRRTRAWRARLIASRCGQRSHESGRLSGAACVMRCPKRAVKQSFRRA